MAFNSNTQILRDGFRNLVVRLTGTCVVGDADQVPTVIINVASLNPPCTAVRVDRVKYSQPNGHPLDVQLYWQATTNELFSGMSSGDDGDYWNFGGLTNNATPGATGNIMWGTSGATDVGGHTAGTILTFAIIIECVKLHVQYPI